MLIAIDARGNEISSHVFQVNVLKNKNQDFFSLEMYILGSPATKRPRLTSKTHKGDTAFGAFDFIIR